MVDAVKYNLDGINLASFSRFVCDRESSVGADGVLLLVKEGDMFGMRMFNPDGSEAEMCGNGIRCVARLVRERYISEDSFTLTSGGGLYPTRRAELINGEIEAYGVDIKVRLTSPDFGFTAGAENHIDKTIVGTEHHFNQAGIPDSTAYKALMAAMEMQPTYSLAPIPSIKKVEKKQTYKGLDMTLMADYIRIAGTEQVKAEFTHMVEGKTAYPTIKSWFLDEFKHFNVNQAKAQIAKHDLTARKAAVRTAVKVKTAKATPAVVELPNASNF